MLTFISVSGTIDVFGVIPHRLKYDAVADDATQSVYLYRPAGMAHGSNIDSASVAWYIILDSTAYTLSSERIFVIVMDSCDVDITYANGAFLQHAARCQIQRVAIQMC